MTNPSEQDDPLRPPADPTDPPPSVEDIEAGSSRAGTDAEGSDDQGSDDEAEDFQDDTPGAPEPPD